MTKEDHGMTRDEAATKEAIRSVFGGSAYDICPHRHKGKIDFYLRRGMTTRLDMWIEFGKRIVRSTRARARDINLMPVEDGEDAALLVEVNGLDLAS